MAQQANNLALPLEAHSVSTSGAHARSDASGGGLSAVSTLSAEEQLLVVRAKAGEHRALREIYNSHNAQVRAHLYRLLGRDCEIDDLTQIVFARAFNALEKFQGNSALSTWLYRITANTTHNLLRQRFRRDRIKTALSWFNAGREAGRVSTSRVEARDEAHRILQRLNPDLREVFVLYHYEGLTLQEIGNILKKPVSTVGDRLTRARKKLKELVAS
ncbi:MAG: RNA polymerase sigma factor [Nannocystaceae bacterium]|nr:RNA polymerase sigma factor [Nannocystaceae bacterium]